MLKIANESGIKDFRQINDSPTLRLSGPEDNERLSFSKNPLKRPLKFAIKRFLT